MDKKFDIKIFVMPVSACTDEKSWQYAVDLITNKLKNHLGDIFEIKLIEIFSPKSFSYEEIMKGIKEEKFKVPVVTVNEKVILSGGKLSERNIKFEIEKLIKEGKNESRRNS